MIRTFEIICSIFGLTLFSPLLFLIIFLNILFQGYPIIFLHKRLGKNGKTFNLIKFRTMLNGPSLSAKHDVTRITRWGRFLRKTSIDELPVLLNVIKGEMSLVGPRPMPEKYLERFNKSQIKRLKVKPGITGLAQINGRNKLSWEERFNFDIYYVENRSFPTDLKIIFQTIILVIRGVGVTSKDHEIMPEFMGKKKISLNTNKIKLATLSDLKNHKAQKKYFVGFDSDGTIFDSMELKHRDCFIDSLINIFTLSEISREVHQVWNYVNIYSNTRGTNRFKALIHTFNHLKNFDNVKSLNINIPDLNELNDWVKDSKTLSTENLIDLILKRSGKNNNNLNKVLKWSEEVNKKVKAKVFNLSPLSGAVNAINLLKPDADLMVISNTPLKTLYREWVGNDIYSNIEWIGGQETGNKTEMLMAATKGKYKKDHILIIGDSPGDLRAAKNINALFFPILPLSEEKSWNVFNTFGSLNFINETYSGNFEEDQIKQFQSLLNIEPPWNN